MRDRTDVPASTAVAEPPTKTPVPDEATPPAPSAEESQAAAAAEAVVVETTAELDTLREKLKTAEGKRIPDLQRRISEVETERNKAVNEAKTFRQSMLEWTRRELIAAGAEDRWREIESRESERTGQVLQTEAQRAATMEIINDLLDSDGDDRAFGRYLRMTTKAAQQGGTPLRVTAENLGSFREMFDAARGAASTNSAATSAHAVATPQAQPPAPARTVIPAAPPQGDPQPSVYDRTKGKVSDLFSLGFRRREGAEQE